MFFFEILDCLSMKTDLEAVIAEWTTILGESGVMAADIVRAAGSDIIESICPQYGVNPLITLTTVSDCCCDYRHISSLTGKK